MARTVLFAALVAWHLAMVSSQIIGYSENPAKYTVGVTITDNTGVGAGGTVTSVAVKSPTSGLPSGLTLTSTGVIRGTPSNESAARVYTIESQVVSGATTYTYVWIEVVARAPQFTYKTARLSTSVGATVDPSHFGSPLSTGGAVATYSVSPPFPSGITVDASTGIIEGNTTDATAGEYYTITGTNTGGSHSFSVYIEVSAVIGGRILTTDNIDSRLESAADKATAALEQGSTLSGVCFLLVCSVIGVFLYFRSQFKKTAKMTDSDIDELVRTVTIRALAKVTNNPSGLDGAADAKDVAEARESRPTNKARNFSRANTAKSKSNLSRNNLMNSGPTSTSPDIQLEMGALGNGTIEELDLGSDPTNPPDTVEELLDQLGISEHGSALVYENFSVDHLVMLSPKELRDLVKNEKAREKLSAWIEARQEAME